MFFSPKILILKRFKPPLSSPWPTCYPNWGRLRWALQGHSRKDQSTLVGTGHRGARDSAGPCVTSKLRTPGAQGQCWTVRHQWAQDTRVQWGRRWGQCWWCASPQNSFKKHTQVPLRRVVWGISIKEEPEILPNGQPWGTIGLVQWRDACK